MSGLAPLYIFSDWSVTMSFDFGHFLMSFMVIYKIIKRQIILKKYSQVTFMYDNLEKDLLQIHKNIHLLQHCLFVEKQ